MIPRPISMEENYGATLVLGKNLPPVEIQSMKPFESPYSRLAARTSCVALAYGELIDSNTPAYLVECDRQCISIIIFNVRRGKNPPKTSLYYMDYWITGLLLPLVLGIDNEVGLIELDLDIFIYINDVWVTGVFIYGPASLGTPPPHPMVMGLHSSAPVPLPPCGVGGGGWWWWKKLYMYVYECICMVWMYVSSICIWLWYDMYMNMYVYMLLRSTT